MRFASVGMINTVIDIGLYTLLTKTLFNALVANYISTTAGITVSFFLHKHFTFGKKRTSKPRMEAISFTIITITGLWIIQPLVIYLSMHFLEATSLTQSTGLTIVLLPKLLATIASLLWNYFLYKNVVFRDNA